MDFNPSIWGTYGQWVSSTLTTLAFLTTAFVVFRDTKDRREAQARQVACFVKKIKRSMYEDDQSPLVEYRVSNLSQEPIYDVTLLSHEATGKSIGILQFQDVVLPGKTHEFEVEDYSRIDPPLLSFRDNSGKVWARSVAGYMHRTGSRKGWFGRPVPEDFNRTLAVVNQPE
jgi:hypothetical protein